MNFEDLFGKAKTTKHGKVYKHEFKPECKNEVKGHLEFKLEAGKPIEITGELSVKEKTKI